MTAKALTRTAFGCVVYFAAIVLIAAPIVTFTETYNVVRTQAQGGGTYTALDIYWSNSAGADFTAYRLVATAHRGSFFDPARLQDDRQQNSTNESNFTGSVDTYANTVMSAAAKDDGGFSATISPSTGSYVPSGSGAAAPFSFLDWSVFDTVTGDDNDLNDFPAGNGGPFAVTAPYHIARLLGSTDLFASIVLYAFDSQSGGVPTVYSRAFPQDPEPATLLLLGLAIVSCLGFVRCHRPLNDAAS